MKLEAMLVFLLGACPEYPVVPHPIPVIECSESEEAPTITLIYGNVLAGKVKGCGYLPIKSTTYGGSLRIEIEDTDPIKDYVIMLNNHHLACSNDEHPSQISRTILRKQYAVPMYSLIVIGADDEKGNATRAVVFIWR